MTIVSPANAGRDPYIGEIMMTAGTYCPKGWVEANGQSIKINDETSYFFSTMGTTYRGDAEKAFMVPDFRGRLPMGLGKGAGLTERKLGQKVGKERGRLYYSKDTLKYQAGEKAEIKLPRTAAKVRVIPPAQVIRFCIAVKGTFPTRNK